MPVQLNATTGGGNVTITAPSSVTGTKTLTVPGVNGNIITSADSGTVTQTMLATNVAGNGPAFSVYLGSNQSLSAATYTKIQFNTNAPNFSVGVFDITTNYRFTPTVAGFYQINANWVALNALGAGGTTVIAIYRNGTAYNYGSYGGGTSAASIGVNVASLVYCNGSTDYIEIYAYVANANNIYGNSAYTWANGFLARSA